CRRGLSSGQPGPAWAWPLPLGATGTSVLVEISRSDGLPAGRCCLLIERLSPCSAGQAPAWSTRYGRAPAASHGWRSPISPEPCVQQDGRLGSAAGRDLVGLLRARRRPLPRPAPRHRGLALLR